MRSWRVVQSLTAVALLGCSLATSPTEYVTESTSSSGGGNSDGGGGSGSGGGTADGAGGAGAGGEGGSSAIVAQIFLFGGYRDKPPELVDASLFEDEVYDTLRGDVDQDGRVVAWHHDAPTPLSGQYAVTLETSTGFIALGISDDADSTDRYVTLRPSFAGGQIASWTGSIGYDFPNDRDYVRTTWWGGYAYHVVGVEDDLAGEEIYPGRVEVAPFDPETGELGTFAVTTAFPRVRRAFAARAVDGVLYLIGGYDGSNTPWVDSALIDPSTGEVGEWNPQADLTRGGAPFNLSSTNVCLSDTHLYVVGGQGNNGPSDVVLYTELDPTGTITEWAEAPVIQTGGVRAIACVVLSGRLYVMGGEGPTTRSDLVMSAEIAPDGSLSEWETGHAPLPIPRSQMAAIAYPTASLP